ncbi:MAG: carboxypeptidase regulatory-like domain-containing protein [Lewinellaceae bacterium]|nr:carboxypeptidase regulatory-like domain-containing protein [Saprospiraceae bacterium]MCB9339381.1 carboxypeptidase regulatory-like domain-containing protein [Lewinellaceae bacterium]
MLNSYYRNKADSMVSTMHLILLLLPISFFFTPVSATAQAAFDVVEPDSLFSYEPLLINVYLNPAISFELEVLITDDNDLYVDIEDLFRKLEIPCEKKEQGNKLTGFIEPGNKPYSINFIAQQVTVADNTTIAKNGLIYETGIWYLESNILANSFGLNLTFNPRSLAAKLVAGFELPFVRKLQLENTRNKISKLKKEQPSADTVVPREYNLFKFGMIDWALSSYQAASKPTYNYFTLGIGAELLYGQANVSINYNDQFDYDPRQLQYNWRWVDNDNNLIRQAQLGVIHKQVIAQLNSPVVGASVSNSPTTVRKAKGYYTINDYTEANWTVELYLNDVLLDYTTADASGLYVFKVPIIYGYTVIKLKFYSPLGEERTEERILNVPFTFLPANTCEYEFTGGILQTDKNTQYALGNFNYGATRFLTIGGGVEYLSNLPTYPMIPYAKIAFQPISKMVMNLEYAHDVRLKGLLNYYITPNTFLEVDYEKYKEGQEATNLNALEARRISLTIPLRLNKVSLLSKMKVDQFIYKNFHFNQFSFILSAYYKQFSANLAYLVNWVSENRAFMSMNLLLSYKLRNGFAFRPLAEYNLSEKEFIRARVELEKRIHKLYFSISYERNFLSKDDIVFLSSRYDLPFARTGFSASYAQNNLIFAESAQGSFAFGGDHNFVKTSNNSSLGKGGVLFYPFLDLNQNGIQDEGEKRILLSLVRVSGAKAVISEKDSIIRISDLNAFVNYTVEFSDGDLENIAWRFQHKSYQVMVDPNGYKRVYVPVIAVGEVNGTIYMDADSTSRGIGRITIQIFDGEGQWVAETLSEPDGYFSYLGLSPGNYTLRVDAEQLESLNYQSSPVYYKGAIRVSEDGDVVNYLDFHIKPR